MAMKLLATKFYQPAAHPRQVLRPQIDQRLDEGFTTGCQLTLVSAPAGFGKSTCVSEWLNHLDVPSVWLSLDTADNDPGRFFAYFVAALQKVDAAIGREIEDFLEAGQLPPGEMLITSLLEDILKSGRRFILVLDDFHVIREEIILKGLETVVGNQPRNMHLALITREDPQLPLARMRAYHQLTEIRAGDLRFTHAEAVRFLNGLVGLRLKEKDIDVLEERTEGWAAGLQLAAIALQSFLQSSSEAGRSGVSDFIAHLSGSHRYILSYLTEEVLNRQPEAVQTFLLQTSILDSLCGALCDAVTGQTGSRLLLERLQHTNLFLIPLDDEQHWYRYHHLFAGLLQDRQRALRIDDTAVFHRRASEWYLREGMLNEAIQHALAGKDYAQAMGMIESQAMRFIMQGYVMTVESWLNAVPSAFRAQSPRTNLAFAWMHLSRGTYPQAAAYVERLQATFSAAMFEQESPALQAEWLALQSSLLTTQGKAEEGLELAQRALQLAPGQEGFARSLVYNALGCAYLGLNDYPQSVKAYQAAIQEGRSAGNIVSEMMGISVLAQMVVQHGQLHFAREIASQGIEGGKRRDGQACVLPSILAIEYATLGQVYYQWCQLEQARGHFLRAIQLSSLGGDNDLELFYHACLSRLLQFEGDIDAAAQEIQTAVEQMHAGAHVWAREEVIAQQVSVYVAQNRLAEAMAILAQMGNQELTGPVPDTFALPNLAPDQRLDYPVGRLCNGALRILVKHALLKGSLESLQPGIELAGHLIAQMMEMQYLPVVIETLLLRAQIVRILGNEPDCFDDVIRALEMAEPEGFISIFIEEGPPVMEVLEIALKEDRYGSVQPAYIQNILAAYTRSKVAATHPAGKDPAAQVEPAAQSEPDTLIEPLSTRELEVLQLIGEGFSNQEISVQLVLSLHTVKKHISNLFSKLGVNSRTQATAQARKLRLLEK